MTDYTVVERTVAIDAAPSAILPFLKDLRRWQEWSPWEGLDDSLHRTYSGPDSGPGAAYEWSGNRKAGAGRMEVAGVEATGVDIDLEFTKPFKSVSKVRFDLNPATTGTTLVWRMSSPKTKMSRVVGLVMNMERLIGKDLERGLADLKRVVESQGS